MQFLRDSAVEFSEPKTNTRRKLELVTQFRESIEIAHTSEYENFLKCLFSAFSNALRKGAPQLGQLCIRVYVCVCVYHHHHHYHHHHRHHHIIISHSDPHPSSRL